MNQSVIISMKPMVVYIMENKKINGWCMFHPEIGFLQNTISTKNIFETRHLFRTYRCAEQEKKNQSWQQILEDGWIQKEIEIKEV